MPLRAECPSERNAPFDLYLLSLSPFSRMAALPPLPSPPSSQVVILMDALDEGDPPEQQRPGYDGGIMACANKALMLVINCLAAKLPPNVR